MYQALQQKIQEYTAEEQKIILKAYQVAKEAHAGQKRRSGEEYFIHPYAVAESLIALHLDASTIAAAFLHDVIEDTAVTKENIIKMFGDEIFQLVQSVTKLDKIEFQSKEEEDAENFRKLFVAMAKDIRVIIIKLADRLHNMQTLDYLSRERQIAISKETQEIYAPIAGRLGMQQMKSQLEDLSFKYLDNAAFLEVRNGIAQKLQTRTAIVDSIVQEIEKILKESDIQAEVFGRPKHFASIYKKMQEQHKSIDEIYDLIAVRVLVATIDNCYEVLGKIHKQWKPIPGRIKDYIAMPKKNLYQSLHTTVMTNYGQTVEIQIRTYEMNIVAEFGVAAHWLYKEKRVDSSAFTERLSWIREIMDWEGSIKDSKDFLQLLKTELYDSEILVFTPQGKVISLPHNATPIDFAYSIHSEVGNHCIGAKINEKIVPLHSKLKTGDVIEILTSPTSKGPSWDWLRFAQVSRTKAKIKQFFKREMKEENVKVGRSILMIEAKKRGYILTDLLTEESFQKVNEKLNLSNIEELYASIGYGAIRYTQVLFKLINLYKLKQPNLTHWTNSTKEKNGSGILVQGMSGLLTHLAGCCNPLPGEKIVGIVRRERGIVIHRIDCCNVQMYTGENKLLEASWAKEQNIDFIATIFMETKDMMEGLNIVTLVLKEMRLKLSGVNSRKLKSGNILLEVSVHLQNKDNLENLMKQLEKNQQLLAVYR